MAAAAAADQRIPSSFVILYNDVSTTHTLSLPPSLPPHPFTTHPSPFPCLIWHQGTSACSLSLSWHPLPSLFFCPSCSSYRDTCSLYYLLYVCVCASMEVCICVFQPLLLKNVTSETLSILSKYLHYRPYVHCVYVQLPSVCNLRVLTSVTLCSACLGLLYTYRFCSVFACKICLPFGEEFFILVICSKKLLDLK